MLSTLVSFHELLRQILCVFDGVVAATVAVLADGIL